MTVTVDQLVLVIGKQAVELDALRAQVEALRTAVAERDEIIEHLRKARQQAAEGGEK